MHIRKLAKVFITLPISECLLFEKPFACGIRGTLRVDKSVGSPFHIGTVWPANIRLNLEQAIHMARQLSRRRTVGLLMEANSSFMT